MDDEANPWRRAAAAALTPPSTSSTRREQPRKPSVPAAIGRMIAELGLRYRPTATTDLAAHGEALRLLTLDVADLPPARLERAIATWVRAERWMPRASDLIALCLSEQQAEIEHRAAADPRSPHEQADAFCNSRNAGLAAPSHPRHRHGLEWYVDGADQPRLRYRRDRERAIEPIHRKHVADRNASLAKLNAVFRYADDGSPRDLTADEERRRIERGGPSFGAHKYATRPS